jgi:putative peptidoglycan lipid II flippase
MLWVLRRRLGGFDGRRLALSVARVLAASAAGGVACWGARSGVDWVLGAAVGGTLHVKAVAAIELLAGAAAGGLVYVGACVLLRAQELREAVGLLRRRARPA